MIKDVQALKCTIFHFVFNFYCFCMVEKICLFSYRSGEINKQTIHGIAKQISASN